MRDPWRRLQYLPWQSLLQVSAITLGIVAGIEFLLSLGYAHFPTIRRILALLYRAPLDTLMILAAAIGVGVLAIYLLERIFPQVFINTATLWGLVPCLVLFVGLKSLLLKSILPLSVFLVDISYLVLIGIVIGVFWKGRPYWR